MGCCVYAGMVSLFEKYGEQLVEYWQKSLDSTGSAVLSVSSDLSRTVRVESCTPCVEGSS